MNDINLANMIMSFKQSHNFVLLNVVRGNDIKFVNWLFSQIMPSFAGFLSKFDWFWA